MKISILAFFMFLPLAGASAQDFKTCPEDVFREAVRTYVSKGNSQYDRSYRKGIKAYADSLEFALRVRSEAGLLNFEDALEFTADLMKLRGDWHYENGNYDEESFKEAERCFLQAISLLERSNFKSSLQYLPIVQREMAQLMYRTKRFDEALEYTRSAFEAYITAFDNGDFDETDNAYETFLSLKTQMAMCLARTGNTSEALSLIDELAKGSDKSSELYFETLRKKGKILILSQRSGCEREALQLYRQFFEWKKTDALNTLGTMTSEERGDYWMRIRPFVADCYQLENADPSFLYDVTLFSKGLLLQLNRLSGYGKASEEALRSLKCTWKQIRSKLPEDACAIEFVQYEKCGRQKMGAVVLKKTGSPMWVQMMSPDDFMNYEIDLKTNRERLYSPDGRSKNPMYTDSLLQTFLWNEDLRDAIGHSRKIYFAPDGYLHQFAIEYILPNDMEDIDVYRLTSTRRLMEDPSVRIDAALLVGGVDYDVAVTDAAFGNDAEALSNLKRIGTGSRALFQYLKGSRAECDSIYAIRNCPDDSLLVGRKATEFSLRTLGGLYHVLNISTHGYFGAAGIPQGTDIKTSMRDESLSQCILALAGANKALYDSGTDASRMDGLLSAKELSECNLSEVDLAVIPACGTGSGFITADGVFGIQRGLKNAGVKCMAVSLWDVDDEATCILNTSFHKNLHEGMPVHKAFMAARESLSEKSGRKVVSAGFNACSLAGMVTYSDVCYDEPQFRNSFVIIDALE